MTLATQRIVTVDPSTGRELEGYAAHSPSDVETALAGAHAAFATWRRTPLGERRERMLAAAGLLRAEREAHARLITAEMGKPLAEALAEVDKCVLGCGFYAAEAEGMLAEERVETGARASFVAYEPLGVVLAVMPWNYPFWQVLRFAAPALMAGNAALLKHAPNE